MADVALGLVIPWVLSFGRDRKARNFFLALTAVVTALTDWNAQERRRSRR